MPLLIGTATLSILVLGGLMVTRAGARVNKVPLAAEPKGVTVVAAKAARYRPARRYVGTLEPWIAAHLGPQLIAAYVDTVLVRPGDPVKRGQVVATLDCRNASASSRAVASQARAIQERQEALAHEAARIAELQKGGFASPNEIEKKQAESASEAAELQSTQAKMQRAALEVNDCVLRAPFTGEIAHRSVDPGAFVHPGDHLVSLVDRSTVRVTAQVPESDFEVVAPGTPVRIRALANGHELSGTVSRRSPAADPSTRTVHFEIDVSDPQRELPVGTTAELTIEVGELQPVTELPVIAASIRGKRATVFIASGGVAHKAVYELRGERGGSVFLDPSLPAGTDVVTAGRGQLNDGDPIQVGRGEAAEASR